MLFMVLFIIAVVIGLFAFDAVLRSQSLNYPEQWERDGYPWGFFIFQRKSSFLAGCGARGRVMRQWMFSNPAWTGTDGLARSYLFLMRFSTAMGIVFWVLGTLKILAVF